MTEKTVPTTTEERPLATREEELVLTPAVDIFETEEGLGVVADLPGVEKDGVEVGVENSILTIRGKVCEQCQRETQYNEFRLRNYFRQFELSDEVDVDRIEAQMKHGVLCVRLPRVAAKQPRRIEVKVAS